MTDDELLQSVLNVLEESLADSSYVGSARSEEAYHQANSWLLSHAPSSSDKLFVRVQTAVTQYAKLRGGS